MRLDALAVAIRPRHNHEAADLGVAFAIQHVTALGRIWLLLILPLLLLSLLVEHSIGACFAFLLLWWLKPLFDYAVLWFLSRAAFGEKPGLRPLLKAIPGFFGQGLWSALLWRRLSLSRAFVMPVWLLEGLSGTERTQRIRVLRQGKTPSRTLHEVFGLFESIIFLSMLAMAMWMVPGMLPPGSSPLTLSSTAGTLYRDVSVSLYALTIGVVEPLYVAAGFMSYLNRRASLEAWDVEIALRRLVSQLPASREAA